MKKDNAKMLYKSLDWIIRAGWYDASLEPDDTAELIIMSTMANANQQLDVADWRGIVSKDTIRKLENWFGLY